MIRIPISIAQEVLNQGADCVISTLTRVDRRLMNFYYRYFCDSIFNKAGTIEDASEDAFNMAVRSIAKFYTNIDDDAYFEQIQGLLGKHVEDGDSTFYLQTYGNTIKIIINKKNKDGNDILRNFNIPRYGSASNPLIKGK